MGLGSHHTNRFTAQCISSITKISNKTIKKINNTSWRLSKCWRHAQGVVEGTTIILLRGNSGLHNCSSFAIYRGFFPGTQKDAAVGSILFLQLSVVML